MLDIPLLIEKDIDNIDLTSLLKIHFEKEIIKFETKCENCHKIVNHMKEIKLARLPKILILSLS